MSRQKEDGDLKAALGTAAGGPVAPSEWARPVPALGLHHGDCLDVMPTLEAGSVNAVVTDPPAGIAFMGKTWDRDRGGRTQWVAWMTAVMSECLRVLKPGGWLVCWSLPRTSHWTAWAIEDAGFKLTDVLMHVFASGFPKGRSQMKPAYEPWILARKPGPLRELAIDRCRIGIGDEEREVIDSRSGGQSEPSLYGLTARSHGERFTSNAAGRWPANVILTDPIFDGDTPGVVGGGPASNGGEPTDVRGRGGIWHDGDGVPAGPQYGDSGTYSRFFLLPKAARSEREPVLATGPTRVVSVWGGDEDDLTPGKKSTIPRQNHHPTVKPLDLMRHLVRLVTPTGGTCLDPFAGSGTTALACELEGFPWIAIEREAEYVAIIEARLNGTQRGLGLPA